MTNLLEQAISCDDGDRAAKIIKEALGIESDDVLNYTLITVALRATRRQIIALL